MNIGRIAITAVALLFSLTWLTSLYAADLRLRCEVRDDRSKISVDAKNLRPGEYQAIVKSGSNRRISRWHMSIGDEVEIDFDSDREDIAEGATGISRGFIKNGRTYARIVDRQGFLVADDTVPCRRK